MRSLADGRFSGILKAMLLPDLIFDLLLFGALLLGAALDGIFPVLHGVTSLLTVGAATYIAAQEGHEFLERRGWWSQESLWTSVALCAVGFLYFGQRNQSDLSLLGLSIGLMLASLMVTIALLSSLSATIRDVSPRPLMGFLVSSGGALALGALAGLLALALGRDGAQASLATKLLPIVCALALWKLRETVRPPRDNSSLLTALRPEATLTVHAAAATYESIAAEAEAKSNPLPEPIAPLSHRALIPRRGTLLDRLWPALIVGALLIAARGGLRSPLEASAVANQNGGTLAPDSDGSNSDGAAR